MASNIQEEKEIPPLPATYIAALIPVAVAINVIGAFIVNTLRLPIFLDFMGIAIAAFLAGPWWGASTGVLTCLAIALVLNPIYLPFAPWAAIGGLIYGYGAKYGLVKSFARIALLGLIVGIAGGFITVPIYVFVFGGATGHFSDVLTASFLAMGQQLAPAVLYAKLITEIPDKMLSTFIGVAILQAMPEELKKRVPGLTKAPPLKRGLTLIVAIVILLIIGLIVVPKILGG